MQSQRICEEGQNKCKLQFLSEESKTREIVLAAAKQDGSSDENKSKLGYPEIVIDKILQIFMPDGENYQSFH